jgi:outer membrane lipoprotein SlyB
MFRPAIRSLAGAAVVVTLLGVAACAPTNTKTTYPAADIGRTRSGSCGVILSMRPVTVPGEQTVGYVGSNDVRADILRAIGGATVTGMAGTAAGQATTTGTAMEFIIREDSGQIISVVQTNGENFRPGERLLLTRGARTRIARVPG